jgi:hypothetical protein
VCLLCSGVEETDIMPEKASAVSNTQDTAAPAQKKKSAEKLATITATEVDSESERTLTDGGECHHQSLFFAIRSLPLEKRESFKCMRTHAHLYLYLKVVPFASLSVSLMQLKTN